MVTERGEVGAGEVLFQRTVDCMIFLVWQYGLTF